MKIALLSDVHANLPPLESVLADLAARHGEPPMGGIRRSELPDDLAEHLRTGGCAAAGAEARA